MFFLWILFCFANHCGHFLLIFDAFLSVSPIILSLSFAFFGESFFFVNRCGHFLLIYRCLLVCTANHFEYRFWFSAYHSVYFFGVSAPSYNICSTILNASFAFSVTSYLFRKSFCIFLVFFRCLLMCYEDRFWFSVPSYLLSLKHFSGSSVPSDQYGEVNQSASPNTLDIFFSSRGGR